MTKKKAFVAEVKVLTTNLRSDEYNITHQRKEVRELSTRLDTADDKSPEKQAQQLTNGLQEERSGTQQLSEQQNNGH